jgi:phi LC3 family holin
MKINWKVRFQNKVWLTSFIALILSFIYNLLGLLNIEPIITQNEAGQIVSQFLMILGMLGVVVDPTTDGVEDSNRAMGYAKPWNDEVDSDSPNE